MLGTGGFLRVSTALAARWRPSRNSRRPSTFRTVISGWESVQPRGRLQANLRRFRESSENDRNRDDCPYRCFWSVCYGKADSDCPTSLVRSAEDSGNAGGTVCSSCLERGCVPRLVRQGRSWVELG